MTRWGFKWDFGILKAKKKMWKPTSFSSCSTDLLPSAPESPRKHQCSWKVFAEKRSCYSDVCKCAPTCCRLQKQRVCPEDNLAHVITTLSTIRRHLTQDDHRGSPGHHINRATANKRHALCTRELQLMGGPAYIHACCLGEGHVVQLEHAWICLLQMNRCCCVTFNSFTSSCM